MTLFKYTIKKAIKYMIILLTIVIFLLIGNTNALVVQAEAIAHTDVLEDLQKDSSFNIADYPIMTYDQFVEINSDTDTSNDKELINVLHIGESDEKELYIYTYQPIDTNYSLTAKYITMSVGENSLDYNKYELKEVSSNSVFKKYKVLQYFVSNDVYRYYNISEIERPFDSLIDTKISDETITDYKTHAVGQTWCCYYQNDTIVYESESKLYVEITPTLTDYIYYGDGFTFGDIVNLDSACHSHYIAFNVENFEVTKIYDADITYKTIEQKYTKITGLGEDEYTKYLNKNGEWVETPTEDDWNIVNFKITYEQKAEYKGEGLWAQTFNWERIMSAKDFVSKLEEQGGSWGTTTKETLLKSEFVFAFTETSVSSYKQTQSMQTFYTEESTKVAEVDILRLHFATKNATYNLGVVSDTTTADNIPGGTADGLDTDAMQNWFEKILMLIGILILLVILNFTSPIFSTIFNVLMKCIRWIIKGLMIVISAPFKLIGQLFKSNKRKR